MTSTARLAGVMVCLLGCSGAIWGGGAAAHGKAMQEMDDLATDDVQGVARRYRDIGPSAVDKLVKAMRGDSRGRVRANAVTALADVLYHAGRIGDARPYLLEALRDQDPDVVARAADSLAGWLIGEPGVREALARRVPVLREAAGSPDVIVQLHAVTALQQMGEQPPVAGMLAASNAGLRQQGIDQAAKTRDAAAVPRLIELARHDPETFIRVAAIPVAAQLASPEVRDSFLAPLVDDAKTSVANAAIRAAGATGAVALAPRLRAIAAEPMGQRTNAAIVALAALGDQAAIPAIAGHLDDQSASVRTDVLAALNALVGEGRTLPDWQAWARERGYLPRK